MSKITRRFPRRTRRSVTESKAVKVTLKEDVVVNDEWILEEGDTIVIHPKSEKTREAKVARPRVSRKRRGM